MKGRSPSLGGNRLCPWRRHAWRSWGRLSTSAQDVAASTWAVGHPLCRPARTTCPCRDRRRGSRERRDGSRGDPPSWRRARQLPGRDPGDMRAGLDRGRAGSRGRPAAARARRRPLDRHRHAQRARRFRAGRGSLARRPRRPEHTGDDAQRQRARNAACGRAGPLRRDVRKGRAAASRRRSVSASRWSECVRSIRESRLLFASSASRSTRSATSTAAASSP